MLSICHNITKHLNTCLSICGSASFLSCNLLHSYHKWRHLTYTKISKIRTIKGFERWSKKRDYGESTINVFLSKFVWNSTKILNFTQEKKKKEKRKLIDVPKENSNNNSKNCIEIENRLYVTNIYRAYKYIGVGYACKYTHTHSHTVSLDRMDMASSKEREKKYATATHQYHTQHVNAHLFRIEDLLFWCFLSAFQMLNAQYGFWFELCTEHNTQ